MKHYNPSIHSRVSRIFNSKGESFDEVDGIMAVVPVSPACNIVRAISATNTTGVAIYTVPSDKDFYLVAVSLSVTKDATATSTLTSIQVNVDGVQQNLVSIAGITLTAQSDSITLSLPFPVKVDRGSQIFVANNTNVANVRAHACIMGYTEESMSSPGV